MPFNTPFDSKDFTQITRDLLDAFASGENGRPRLTDQSEGSVIRTLAEAFARELAVCYQQLRYVYQHGFLDTAEGAALDNVVALLGVSRQRAGHIEGSVVFARPQPAPEDIPIPASTEVAGRDVPVFITTENTLLRKGSTEVTVKVRSQESSALPVKAGALNLMPRPILGIDTVSNPADLLPVQQAENDAELRERTRHLLQTANLGTLAALEQTVRSLGITQVTVREDAQKAGVVSVILGDNDIGDALLAQAKAAVDAVRPAGIKVDVSLSRAVLIRVTATLVMRSELPLEQQKTILEQITQGLKSYFASLKTGELVLVTKIKNILTASDQISELLESDAILAAFTADGERLNNVDSSHLAANGDVRIENNERALLDVDKLPLRLSLEPPVLDVWLDVVIGYDDPQNPPSPDIVTEQLKPRLDTIKENTDVSYDALLEPLGKTGFKVQFRLLHSQTNLTVELNQSGDANRLGLREKLRLGRIDIKQAAS